MGRKRLVVFGTFDIIHPSHLQFLLEARKVCDTSLCELIVVVARDSSILRIKGRKPIFNEKDRLRLLSGLKLVDYTRLGYEGENHFAVISDLQPDYIVLGYDQLNNEKPLREYLQNQNLDVQVYRLPKYESGDLSSSSEVRERIVEIFRLKKRAPIKENDIHSDS